VETEAIILIQTQQMAIIILVQDVIMDIVEVVVHGQQQLRVEIQTHRRNKQRRGGIIVIRVHLQHFQRHQPIVHRHHLMAVHQAVVHLLAEVRQVVAEVVEVEVQDKINKTLTSKIPSKRTFEGIFSFKV
jgi:hypothetical protein